jgi:hypothetical protein
LLAPPQESSSGHRLAMLELALLLLYGKCALLGRLPYLLADLQFRFFSNLLGIVLWVSFQNPSFVWASFLLDDPLCFRPLTSLRMCLCFFASGCRRSSLFTLGCLFVSSVLKTLHVWIVILSAGSVSVRSGVVKWRLRSKRIATSRRNGSQSFHAPSADVCYVCASRAVVHIAMVLISKLTFHLRLLLFGGYVCRELPLFVLTGSHFRLPAFPVNQARARRPFFLYLLLFGLA